MAPAARRRDSESGGGGVAVFTHLGPGKLELIMARGRATAVCYDDARCDVTGSGTTQV